MGEAHGTHPEGCLQGFKRYHLIPSWINSDEIRCLFVSSAPTHNVCIGLSPSALHPETLKLETVNIHDLTEHLMRLLAPEHRPVLRDPLL